MLISFGAKKFKSFEEEFSFSMEAAPKQKGLDYSIKTVKVGKRQLRLLSSSVIYGPNAAGKTSVICALDFLKHLVLQGNLRNSKDPYTGNPVLHNLNLIPNFMGEGNPTIKLFISFLHNEVLFDYAVSFSVGDFMQVGVPRRVVEESLWVNEKRVFLRQGFSLEIGNLSSLKDFFPQEVFDEPEKSEKIAINSLIDEELFLSNGFKSIYGKILYPMIFNFFYEKLNTFCNTQNMRLTPPMDKGMLADDVITNAAHIFGSDANDLGFYKENDDSEPVMVSKINGKNVYSLAIESLGTIRFTTIFPAIVKALQNGGTLVVDELDNSLHPMAVMSIINLFHNDDINKNGAQLIFNSQNPLYLNNNLFRRDEIKFVDRTSNEKGSVLYSLSDFGTRGTSARKGKDYMENYFIDKYGAIKQIDFTDLFERIMGGENAS